ncbi:hypothetical protein FOZ62_012447 [Perkinsus olseni]|uniref:Uncharacterized protein n=1 Tax=Perkinsus olseni TaxID=32597 RepID=A0A7J6N8H7_PEROL|nr:hypothetical protein FOZ62_012447 [Perkinsus olseni]
MTQWKPKSRHSATKEKREARSENSSDSSNRATSSSQVVEYKLKALGGEKFVGKNIRDLSTQKALMQWIEAEHLKMLYSKEEVEQAFGNSLTEEKFVDNCREYACRVMPDRADVYHSSMEDIINELLNIAVMDTYAAKAGDSTVTKTITDHNEYANHWTLTTWRPNVLSFLLFNAFLSV